MSNSLPYTEQELLQQLAGGNEKAFEHFYQQHWNKIYSMALAYLKSSQQAQDIVQEVFIKLWNNREKLNKVEKPAAYLFSIGRNEVIDALRKKTKLFGIEDATGDLPDDLLSPAESIDLKTFQATIAAAIEKLPQQQKKIFRLSREEGLSHEQIAERLGIEKGTVKNHIVRALHTLRRQLGLEKNSLIFWFLIAEWLTKK